MSKKTDSLLLLRNFSFRKLLYHFTFFDALIVFGPLVLLVLLLFDPIKDTVTPFFLGAVAAYILMPIVRLLQARLRLPKLFSMLFVFFLFAFMIIFSLSSIIRIFNHEIRQIIEESQDVSSIINLNYRSLPIWMQPFMGYFADSFINLSKKGQENTLPILKNTIETVIHLFAFFVATFYVLKDGDYMVKNKWYPKLFNDLHETIQNYFRGQIILILLMFVVTWLFLNFLQVKFAFLLSLFTGIAEVVPYVGPISAALISMSTVILTGNTAIGDSSFTTAIFVGIGYFTLRQLEDFFIIPVILGHTVRLHPLAILLITLLAGKLYGFTGLLFGIPFVATYKTVIEYMLEEKNNR